MHKSTHRFYAATLHDVPAQLEQFAAWCERHQDPLGYFAVLYRIETLQVIASVDAGQFDDNARMARMGAVFANRYLAALSNYAIGHSASGPWEAAFQAAKRHDVNVVQHLVLAINAHINFDLPIAAAEVCPGPSIHGFKNDFEQVHTILASLLDMVEDDLAKVWTPMKILLPLGEKVVSMLLDVALDAKRKKGWEHAVELAQLEPTDRETRIAELERSVTELGQRILDPGPSLEPFMKELRQQEKGTVAQRIEDFRNAVG